MPGSVTFNSGDTEKEITFSATQDSQDDDGDAVILGFGPTLPSQVTRGTTSTTTVDIEDDDVPTVIVNFEQTAHSIAEGSNADVTVTLSADPERSVTVTLTAINRDGATSADYTIAPAGLSLTFLSGETGKSLTFSAANDDLDDDGESVKLAIGTVPTDVTKGPANEATVNIVDDPNDVPTVTVNFASSAYTVDENATVEVTLTLNIDPERTVVIPIVRTNEQNASDADYASPPMQVTFASDENSKSFMFTPVDDDIDDDGERVKLELGATLPDGVSRGSTNSATVSITDNDSRGVTVAPPTLRIDEGDTGEYTVVLDSEPTADVTVTIGAPTNTDITVDETSLTFRSEDWDQVQTVTVTAVQEVDLTDDADDTGTITHTVSGGDYATVMADAVSVTVIDDEAPQVKVEFDRAAGEVTEGGEITFSVRLSKDPDRGITIPIVVRHHDGASSADYTLSATSVMFEAGGVLSQDVTLTAVDDILDDDGESVTLAFGTLTSGVSAGAINEATVSINDNDDPSVTVRFVESAHTVDEGESIMLDVVLSADPKRMVTIPIATTIEDAAGGDYGLPDSVTFNDGETTKSINFTATDDAVDDDSGHVIVGFDVSLLQNIMAGNQTTVRITDYDGRGVMVSPDALTVAEGGSASYEVALTSQPTDVVTVAITAPTNTDITVDVPSLTFTTFDWNTAQRVTVSAAADDMDAQDDTGIITHAVSGGDYASVRADPVSVTVDDDEVSISFEHAAYSVAEGGDAVTVTVRLSAAADTEFTIDLDKTDQNGATEDDYSGLPDSLTFAVGDTEQSFSFSALADTESDAGESVLLEFVALPDGVIAGAPAQATLTISGSTTVTRRPVTDPGGGGGGGGGGAPLNRSPEFSDGSTTNRSVAENTPAGANIGDPVAARDREDDTLTYSLRGVDAASFDLDPATGQLLTKAGLDYEAQAAYSVIVSVSDGKSSSGRDSDVRDDSVTVTIDVVNVDEPGAVALSPRQPQVDIALTATLTDLDGGLAGIVWLWERSADQADWTEVDGARTESYTPVVGDLSSYLRVTASYTDGHERGKSAGAVTGDPVLINTVPRFPGVDADGGIAIEVEEGSGDAESGGIGEPVAAADPDGDTLTYSLSGDDAGSFEIDASTGQLWSNAPLDYETQAVYTVVVSVRDGRDFNGDPDTAVDAEVTVTIAVVNVGEPGTLTLLSSEPRVGVPFAARLTDPDGVVGEVAWQWERSRDGNPWSSSWRAISGAESSAYEPVDADLGYYLRVTASYADGHGPDKSRQAISDAAVMENTGPVFPDALNGVFERSVGGERWRGRGRGRSGGGNKSRRRRADPCARRHRRGAVRHRRGHGADQGRDGAGLRGGQERLRGDRHGHGRIGG